MRFIVQNVVVHMQKLGRKPGNEATDVVQVLGRSWMKIGPISTFDLQLLGFRDHAYH